MLNRTLSRRRERPGSQRAGERGIVLLVALIVLIAMTMAGVALMRSTSTGNRIAGNLSFQQAATQSADVGVERAVAWLEANNVGITLHNDIDKGGPNLVGYFATRLQEPPVGTSWDTYWNATIAATARVNTLPKDAAGNTTSYVIQRLCNAQGSPTAGVGCSVAPGVVGAEGNSMGSGVVTIATPNQQYYRITARVLGPRNTVSFVQVIVAL